MLLLLAVALVTAAVAVVTSLELEWSIPQPESQFSTCFFAVVLLVISFMLGRWWWCSSWSALPFIKICCGPLSLSSIKSAMLFDDEGDLFLKAERWQPWAFQYWIFGTTTMTMFQYYLLHILKVSSKIKTTHLVRLLFSIRFGQPPLVIGWWGEGVLEDNLSLFSDVALPLVVAATTEATVVAVVTSPLEFVFATRFVVGDEYREESEQVVFEVVELCDTVELMDSSSCRFFSYSVCFPCCISSFVKLAASSPKQISRI